MPWPLTLFLLESVARFAELRGPLRALLRDTVTGTAIANAGIFDAAVWSEMQQKGACLGLRLADRCVSVGPC